MLATGVHLDVVRLEFENASNENVVESGEIAGDTTAGLYDLDKKTHQIPDSVRSAFFKAAPLNNSEFKLKLTNCLIKDREYPVSNADQGDTLIQWAFMSY